MNDLFSLGKGISGTRLSVRKVWPHATLSMTFPLTKKAGAKTRRPHWIRALPGYSKIELRTNRPHIDIASTDILKELILPAQGERQ